MRKATVVLPVPGLPVKDMCRLGACACMPKFSRSLLITSSAAMSRMRPLMGARPTRSRSNSSITAPAWLCASTCLTVLAGAASGPTVAAASFDAAAVCGGVANCPAIPYMGSPGRQAAYGVAQHARMRFLAHQVEAGLVRRPIDDEAHRDGLDSAGGIECHQADVVLRKGLAAVLQLQHHARGIVQVEH